MASDKLCELQSPQKEGQAKYVFSLREVEDGVVFGPKISIKLKIKQKAIDDETTLYKIKYIGASDSKFNADGACNINKRIQNTGTVEYPEKTGIY